MATNEHIVLLLADVAKRLSAIEEKISGSAGAPASSPSSGHEVSKQTAEFDELVAKFGVAFRDASTGLGADAAALVRGWPRSVADPPRGCGAPLRTRDRVPICASRQPPARARRMFRRVRRTCTSGR